MNEQAFVTCCNYILEMVISNLSLADGTCRTVIDKAAREKRSGKIRSCRNHAHQQSSMTIRIFVNQVDN
ncbi:unnamed protein product [Allacma fusca]|uniref:Uncharacterized protein n=1 Tax=Allacma fusca TaxID=39272 RepID=A0A8J2LCN2_9HEXA|nr:unnamed protein product [Allacma fusca]